MKKINAKFNAAFISEAGSFLQNKDYFAFVELDDFACYVIADGIDDDVDLESGKIAVASIIRQFSEKPSMKKHDIKNWLKVANQELLDARKTMRLKASITVVVTDYASVVYGLAGNTRFQLHREGTLVHGSLDQSLSNDLFEQGKIPKDKIALHLERNNLYCYLGQPEGFNPEVSRRIKLVDGDIITLYTRGIWENIDEGEIADAVKDAVDPQEVLNNIEDMLLSRQPDKLANYTLATIFVDKIYQDPGRRKALIKQMLYAAIPILIIVICLFAYFRISEAHKQEKLDAMNAHFQQAQQLKDEENYVRAAEEYKAALDLAKDLKLQKEQLDFSSYYKTVGLIIAGDTALQQRDYLQAAEKYRAALEACYFADRLGEQYIIKRQRLTNDYISVIELLQLGDQKMEQKNFIAASNAYREARLTAARIYDTEGRKEAADKLAKLGEDMTLDDKKTKAQEGSIYERQAEKMAQMGDYEGAVTTMNIAAGLFEQGGKADKAASVQRKIMAYEDKMSDSERATVQKNLLAEAAKYEKEGDRLASEGDTEGAQEQYSLAMSLFEESGKQERVALLTKKLENQQDRKKNSDNLQLQKNGFDLEKEGDLAVAQNQYDQARNSYYLAQQIYASAGLANNVTLVQKKIDMLDQENTVFEQQKTKADRYVSEANERVQKGEFSQAEYLYLLAKDIYQKLNLTNEVKSVDEKLKLVKKLSKGAA